ncbi:MAG: glycosyltransferase family 2 protein [Phycisphaerales bacterium]|nr:glycosyltransferase family 2 protein [Phycisphaerales bacterium]
MPDSALILLCVLAVLASGTGGYWLAVMIRIRRVRRHTPYLRDGLDHSCPSDLVSIVVPAHNEARVIERLARSVLDQQDVEIELIVVLDRCTDDTRARLEQAANGDPRLRIIEVDHCPDDWAGKCHAARTGSEAAKGQWLLFTDADVHFEPGVLRAAVALAAREEVDLLSAYTTLTARRWWEKVVQPVAAVTLMRQFPTDRVNDRSNPRSFANGQFMLFKAGTYRSIGGHASVKDDLLEDIAFARKIHAADGQVMVVAADGMIITSMYGSLSTMLLGWKRIFIETSRRNPGKLRQVAWRILGSGLGSAVGPAAVTAGVVLMVQETWLVGSMMLGTGVFATVTTLTALMKIFRLSRIPLIGVVGWPVGCFLMACTLFSGATDLARARPIPWGGRTYIIEPLGHIRPGS